MGAEQALKHEFLNKNKLIKVPIMKLKQGIVDNLRRFRKLNKLQRATINIVASMLSDEALKHLRQCFINLDEDGDGNLSVAELQEKLNGQTGTLNDLSSVFTDESAGRLIKEYGYTEFLAATIDRERCMSDNVLRIAFDMFDKDGSGTISIDELVAGHLLGHIPKEELEQTLRELDTDGNEELDFEEFMDMMRNAVSNRRNSIRSESNKSDPEGPAHPPKIQRAKTDDTLRISIGKDSDSPSRKGNRAVTAYNPKTSSDSQDGDIK